MVFKTVLLAVYLRHLYLDQSWYKTISDKIKSVPVLCRRLSLVPSFGGRRETQIE